MRGADKIVEWLPEINEKYKLGTEELTPQKMNQILAAYAEHPEYDAIAEYLLVLRRLKSANLEDANDASKQAIQNMLKEIDTLLTNVKDPALDSLRKEFLNEKGGLKPPSAMQYNAFRCAAMVIGATFAISDINKRKAAAVHLNGMLKYMHLASSTFSSATYFYKKVEKAVEGVVGWREQVRTQTNTEINTMSKELQAKQDELAKVVSEKDSILSQLQIAQAETMSGKTTATTRTKNGKIEASPERDAIVMRQFWKTSRIALLGLIMQQYHSMLSKGKSQGQNGSLGMLKGWAIELCFEEKTVMSVIDDISSSRDENLKDLKNQIARANKLNMAGGPGLFEDAETSDYLPAFEVSGDATEIMAEGMSEKVYRIANMFGDEGNHRLLPYDKNYQEYFKVRAIKARRHSDALHMQRYWAPSRIQLIQLAIKMYDAALITEKVSYQNGVKLSPKYKTWVIDLGLERKSLADLLKEMKTTLGDECTVLEATVLGDVDPVPGFQGSSSENTNMQSKIKVISEMLSDKSNARLLPFDQEAFQFFTKQVPSLNREALKICNK